MRPPRRRSRRICGGGGGAAIGLIDSLGLRGAMRRARIGADKGLDRGWRSSRGGRPSLRSSLFMRRLCSSSSDGPHARRPNYRKLWRKRACPSPLAAARAMGSPLSRTHKSRLRTTIDPQIVPVLAATINSVGRSRHPAGIRRRSFDRDGPRVQKELRRAAMAAIPGASPSVADLICSTMVTHIRLRAWCDIDDPLRPPPGRCRAARTRQDQGETC
jgi:hypothetical protein